MNNLTKEALMRKVQELSFAKVDTELYLDTHPGCKTAIDYYHRTVDALDALIEEYENTVGPITARGVVSDEEWTWTNSPWPWHNGTEANGNSRRGEGR